MAGKTGTHRSRMVVLRWITWIILILWGGWWVFFNIASGISEISELGPMGLVMHLIMPAVIIVTMLVVWYWELAGGILLIIEAVFALWFFDVRMDITDFTMLSMVMPAMIAGFLAIICWLGSYAGRQSSA